MTWTKVVGDVASCDPTAEAVWAHGWMDDCIEAVSRWHSLPSIVWPQCLSLHCCHIICAHVSLFYCNWLTMSLCLVVTAWCIEADPLRENLLSDRYWNIRTATKINPASRLSVSGPPLWGCLPPQGDRKSALPWLRRGRLYSDCAAWHFSAPITRGGADWLYFPTLE